MKSDGNQDKFDLLIQEDLKRKKIQGNILKNTNNLAATILKKL